MHNFLVDRGVHYDYNNQCMETLYTSRFLKVGTSLAVIVPVPLLKAYSFQRGDAIVFIQVNGDTLGVRKLSDKEIRLIKEKTDEINIEQ